MNTGVITRTTFAGADPRLPPRRGREGNGCNRIPGEVARCPGEPVNRSSLCSCLPPRPPLPRSSPVLSEASSPPAPVRRAYSDRRPEEKKPRRVRDKRKKKIFDAHHYPPYRQPYTTMRKVCPKQRRRGAIRRALPRLPAVPSPKLMSTASKGANREVSSRPFCSARLSAYKAVSKGTGRR